MCDFQCYNNQVLLKHTKSAHENDPRFLVYCSICGKSMKKWSSLKKHLQREHRSLLTFCTLLKRWICLTSHAFWLASDLHDGSAGGCHSEDKNSSDILYDGQLLTNSECDTVPSTPTIDPKWDQALFYESYWAALLDIFRDWKSVWVHSGTCRDCAWPGCLKGKEEATRAQHWNQHNPLLQMHVSQQTYLKDFTLVIPGKDTMGDTSTMW